MSATGLAAHAGRVPLRASIRAQASGVRSEALTGRLCHTQMRRETSTSGNTRHCAIQVASKICLWKVQNLVGIFRSQRNANTFRGGLVALGGNATHRDQNIGLRIVCGSAPVPCQPEFSSTFLEVQENKATDGTGREDYCGRLSGDWLSFWTVHRRSDRHS